ncbi:MAG: RagB/SusD family nutrient uptake outer membrane protein [Paludibacteraceae bacterium]
MKQIKYLRYILPLAVIMIVFGCTETSEGFLDDKSEGISLKQIFSDSLMTKQYLATVYWKIPATMFAPQRAGYFLTNYYDYNSATDDGKEVSNNRKNFAPAYTKADFSQEGINAGFERFIDVWTEMWGNIRICNQFMQSIDGSPLTQQTKEAMRLEARFLRAFYYFHLLRNFGGVPIVGDEMLSPFENYDLSRSTYEETVNYIASEFKYLAKTLPEVQNNENYGKPTQGAALGMLVKLYHYAASPLSNGGNMGSGKNRLLVGYESEDKNRWQTAKDAIDEFYQYNTTKGYYELLEDTTALGKGFYNAVTTRSNKERIWFWLTDGTAGQNWPSQQLLPKSRDGYLKVVPYHELTEAFPTKDGIDIRAKNTENKYFTEPGSYNSDNTLYDPDKPYANRDPRFYYTFLYNGAQWKRLADGGKEPVWTYRNAQNDGIFGAGSPTGYYYAKLCYTDALGTERNQNRGLGIAFIRYADILLMDAEVMTELDLNGYRMQIEDRLIQIRKRAGIDPGNNNRYGIPENMDKETMIDFILNERRIEFVIEAGNRFWDLQRRKLMEKVLSKTWSHAAVWEKVEGQEIYSWTVQPVEQHYFQSKMYRLPIPLKEWGSAKGKLIQNPGW